MVRCGILAACVVLSFAVAIVPPVAQQRDAGAASICDGTAGAATDAVATPAVASNVPETDGIAVDLFASGVAGKLASTQATGDFELTLKRLVFAPVFGTHPFQARGPILFIVETGEISLSINGRPQTLGQGMCALVQVNQQYGLFNESSDDAVLLRLAVVRGGNDNPIGPGLTPIATQEHDIIGLPEIHQLFQATIVRPGATDVVLFLERLRWERPGVSTGFYRAPGPVGVRIEQGTLTVEDAAYGVRQLPPSGCTLFPA